MPMILPSYNLGALCKYCLGTPWIVWTFPFENAYFYATSKRLRDRGRTYLFAHLTV
jgi:hypothetical protein